MEEEMIIVEDREQIRRAYFIEHQSIREIARQLHRSPKTICKALETAGQAEYTLTQPRASPVLGEYKGLINQLLEENKRLPRKQRYTLHKIFEQVQAAGYQGCESGVRLYVAQKKDKKGHFEVYLPLEFDPGTDAQVDWGEAVADIAGQRETVQLFLMRLNYSRRVFMMAFPAQRQEAFFEGHVRAFHHFQGVPHRIAYDNLKAAVQKILTGHTRVEQERFIAFRSHYLYASHFCTPGQGHEKGGVEHGVGFTRRNFLVPIPNVASYDELNANILAECLGDDLRTVDGQSQPIGQAYELERPRLLPLPPGDPECCVTKPVNLRPYSQVEFETNRYSVPTEDAYKKLVLKAYPFRVEILHDHRTLAVHPRCYGHNQDIFDPLHYLSLLEERPGAFEYAKPLRRWRKNWPPVYERLLARLRAAEPENRSVREFVGILRLHRTYPAELVEQAVTQALDFGCIHADGVRLCLHQLQNPVQSAPPVNLDDHLHLTEVGNQPVDLQCYEQLFKR
jgi:transposase